VLQLWKNQPFFHLNRYLKFRLLFFNIIVPRQNILILIFNGRKYIKMTLKYVFFIFLLKLFLIFVDFLLFKLFDCVFIVKVDLTIL